MDTILVKAVPTASRYTCAASDVCKPTLVSLVIQLNSRNNLKLQQNTLDDLGNLAAVYNANAVHRVD
jgi:hypothetical protein